MQAPQLIAASPDWEGLYALAGAQAGHFTAAQALAAGISPELLFHHHRVGRVERVRRGIYRVRHFPPLGHEDLVVFWLWSERQGTFSHETALALHQLSDVLPARLHLTVPARWKRRRLQVPEPLTLHLADLDPAERTWMGPVPITRPLRTLQDCAADHLDAELLGQAAEQGLARGLFSRAEVARIPPLGALRE